MENIIAELKDIPWSLLAPLLVVQLILMLVALVDCLKRKATNGPQWLWVLVILFVSIIGPVIYFIFGREEDQ